MFRLKLNVFGYFIFLFTISKCFTLPTNGRIAESNEDCKLDVDLAKEIADYQPIVNRIVKELTEGQHKGKTYDELAYFVDKFGNRLSGTNVLEDAIDYMINKSIDNNLDNVHGEPVGVPSWTRVSEKAILLDPYHGGREMSILGLGGSVSTPYDGIIAEAIVVTDFDDLKKQANKAKGKIVVFAPKWESYGKTVKYRQYGAVEAAKVGAVASLIRSATPFSINSPHTGWQDYSDNVTKIPTACITVEDAEMLLRMYKRGDAIKIFLMLFEVSGPPRTSRNTVAELTGRSQPEKVVLVSGHLDSWDVGNGAMDDGGGAFISWYSLVLLKSLGLKPRRTIRTILWTGEEEGLLGAVEYKRAHASEMDNFTLLMESDIGTFTPQGLTFKGSKKASCIMQHILMLFKDINATQFELSNDVGSDIMVWENDNIPLASLKNANEKYFWFHHSNGDTMTVEDPDSLDRCTALWASTAFIVADLSVNLPREN